VKKNFVIGIIVGIAVIVIVLGIVFTFEQESDIIKVEDALDREIQPVEVPEI